MNGKGTHEAAQSYELNAVYEATRADKYPRSRLQQLTLLLWY